MRTLQWRHDERNGVSNHRHVHCLLNHLFGRRSKKTSKPRVTGLCKGNQPVTGEFPSNRASDAENISIWWCHHEISIETPVDVYTTFTVIFYGIETLGQYTLTYVFYLNLLTSYMKCLLIPCRLQPPYPWLYQDKILMTLPGTEDVPLITFIAVYWVTKQQSGR